MHLRFGLVWWMASTETSPFYPCFNKVKPTSLQNGNIWKMVLVPLPHIDLHWNRQIDTRIKGIHEKTESEKFLQLGLKVYSPKVSPYALSCPQALLKGHENSEPSELVILGRRQPPASLTSRPFLESEENNKWLKFAMHSKSVVCASCSIQNEAWG